MYTVHMIEVLFFFLVARDGSFDACETYWPTCIDQLNFFSDFNLKESLGIFKKNTLILFLECTETLLSS